MQMGVTYMRSQDCLDDRSDISTTVSTSPILQSYIPNTLSPKTGSRGVYSSLFWYNHNDKKTPNVCNNCVKWDKGHIRGIMRLH